MARNACFWSLLIIVVHINLFRGDATTFTVENNCNFTVWPAFVNSGITSSGANASTGFSLQSNELKIIDTPPDWVGQITGRTHCSTDSSTGNFTCQSGDCGSGKIYCGSRSSAQPVTLIEFSSGQFGTDDFYDVSVVKGYNLPLTIAPYGGSSDSCAVTGCVFNFYEDCPDDLRVVNNHSSIIGCQSPCDAFNTSASCCTSPSDCQRDSFSLGSLIFKKACPRAYSYARDDATSTFMCGGSNVSYTVTFCPSATVARVVSQPLQSVNLSPSPVPLLSPSQSVTPGVDFPKNPTGSPSTSHSRRKRTVLLVALSTSAVVSIFLLFGFWTCMRRRKIVRASNMEVSEIKKAALDSLQFELNTIRAATNNFSTENKLGEGGFGEVYKGVLENGQEIAVKRLSKNSEQGDVEFKTEVVLVAKLRHKNLVKLLGFCVAFEEKILVYEFLPRSSLDRLLFDPRRQESLDWQTRFNIIVGIARGLLYLHEDSPLKVIHRDLKSSNILLDENLNPKIADFGLAKLFGVDQTQGDTKRIVGTYGYMAPEYAITGHFSVKSDVYSFGVLVLEIVSGQRNRFFGRLQLEEALLHRAWRLWNEEKPLDLVDTTLSNNYSREEVTKCLHIGLLCIQEDAVARPRMTSIVAALNGQVNNLPIPKPPNFFGITTNIDDNNEMQPAFEGVYTGNKTITDLYPRD